MTAASTRRQKSSQPAKETRAGAVQAAADPQNPLWWFLTSTGGLALSSAVLMFAALPPLGWSFLVWLAPVGLVYLIRRLKFVPAPALPHARTAIPERGRGGEGERGSKSRIRRLLAAPVRLARRPYGAIYYASCAYWLLALHWLTLPHWATSFGWVAVSLYLALYWPLFVAVGRVMVHRCRVPLIVAAPIAWVGADVVKAYFITGFSMASLGHALYQWSWVIQIADLGGEYAVGFVVVFVAACLARMLPLPGEGRAPASKRGWSLWPLAPLAAMVAAVCTYGWMRLNEELPPAEKTLRVALLQSNFDTHFGPDPGRGKRVNAKLVELSAKAVAERDNLDLLIWPETTWGQPIRMHDAEFPAPPRGGTSSADKFCSLIRLRAKEDQLLVQNLATHLRTPLLIGANVLYAEADAQSGDDLKTYNSALFIDTPNGKGKFVGRYDKMHPVIFGEYVPFGDYFPWVYDLLPIRGGLDEGDGPKSFEVAGVRLSPSICYETMAPHKTRDQIAELCDTGRAPDVIVNLTNDGWFWGSAELDLHLICGVFRAVENRKPLLVAANTGFSAYVDSNGRIIEQGPRHEEDILFAEVPITPRGSSLYLRWGDWFAWVCFAVCIAAVAWAILGGMASRRSRVAMSGG